MMRVWWDNLQHIKGLEAEMERLKAKGGMNNVSAKTRITIDRLDDGHLVTITDKNGERTAAAETRLAVIDRVLGWMGLKTTEAIAVLDAVKKVMVEG